MDSKTNDVGRLTLAVAASALLFYLGGGLQPHWFLLWLAPVPVLAAASRVTGAKAAGAAGLAWALGSLNLWPFLSTTLALPLAVRLVGLGLPTLAFASAVWCWRRRLVAGAPFRATLLLPALVVAWEFLQAVASPHSTFGSLAYTQMNCGPLVQLAALTGWAGLTFVTLGFSSVVGVLVAPGLSRAVRVQLGAVTFAVLVAVFGWGSWRLRTTPVPANIVHLGLVATTDPRQIYPREREAARALFRAYLDQARMMVAAGATTIVLPEKIAWLAPSDAESVRREYAAFARGTGASIVLGWTRRAGDAEFNEAVLFRPVGSEVAYQKRHLLPGLEEGFTAGDRPVVVEAGAFTLGLAICKDLDFPQVGRDYGQRQAALLLVPAWDFDVDGWLHSEMAVLRGVESGFTLARAAARGRLTVTDATGRHLPGVVGEAGGFATLRVDAPVGARPTFYARVGNWFPWLCVGGAGLVLASSFGRRRPA